MSTEVVGGTVWGTIIKPSGLADWVSRCVMLPRSKEVERWVEVEGEDEGVGSESVSGCEAKGFPGLFVVASGEEVERNVVKGR